MRNRFRDPALRARIIREADEAMAARFSSPTEILLNDDNTTLAQVMERTGIRSPAADLVVLDSATGRDHATYTEPTRPSTGITLVVVSGQLAWRDGQPTLVRNGVALRRTREMVSRQLPRQ